ncbi:hypothetical protein BDP27DRAFT_1364031 [Rhodocollybia butyracea]|uniref:Uncharacterized protein n=1 Tax=Rhodocollybia butyracea TaxID=206335 RepID=A0A9P5PSM8_9AGAR|nr:hypothetical protein BDP27DRAFT_1364031 [Rhodocollybia butyracea]
MAGDSPYQFICPSTSSLQTLVDDNDPRIIYSDGWVKGGEAQFECNGTTHAHAAGSANITATLKFSGVGIQVFGTITAAAPPSDGSPSSIYKVDDLPASTFSYSTHGGDYYRFQLYASPLLKAGNHTLLITFIGDNQSRGTWLDYILYFPSTNELTSISSEAPTPSASIAPEPYANSSTNITHSSCPNVGVITSGVLGGVLGIFLVTFFASIILRRKPKNAFQTTTPLAYEFANNTGHVENTTTPIHPNTSSLQEALLAAAAVPQYRSPPSYRSRF